MPPETTYRPKKLTSDDLRAPMSAGLRRLPPGLRDELHGARVRLVQRLHPWGPTRREERKRSVWTGALAIPALSVVLTPLPLSGVVWLILLGALYGLAITELKPVPLLSGLGLVGIVAVAHLVTGTPLLMPPGAGGLGAGIYFLLAICRLLLLFCLGMILMLGRAHVGE